MLSRKHYQMIAGWRLKEIKMLEINEKTVRNVVTNRLRDIKRELTTKRTKALEALHNKELTRILGINKEINKINNDASKKIKKLQNKQNKLIHEIQSGYIIEDGVYAVRAFPRGTITPYAYQSFFPELLLDIHKETDNVLLKLSGSDGKEMAKQLNKLLKEYMN